jgi:uncharacterized protein (DUF2237 family)
MELEGNRITGASALADGDRYCLLLTVARNARKSGIAPRHEDRSHNHTTLP